MNNYENELINNKKQQLSKEFYAKMEETKQNINLFANTNLNEYTSKDAIAYLVVKNAKLQQENQQLKKERASIMTSLTTSREKYNNDKARYRRKYKNLKKQKDDVVNYIKYLIKRLEEFDIPKRKETGAFWYQVMGELEEILRMLGEIDDQTRI